MRLTPHFALIEFACRDALCTPVPARLVPNVIRLCEQLEIVRAHFNSPVTIRSGYRTPAHNAKVGGAGQSKHLTGEAADLVVEGYTPTEVAATIEFLVGAGRMRDGGLGIYRGWVHYDVRKRRARWGR